MNWLSGYTLAAVVIAVSFVVLWTTTVNSQFWHKTLGIYRMFQSRWEVFAKSAVVAVINVVLVALAFDWDSSLRFFIFFEMMFFAIAIVTLQD